MKAIILVAGYATRLYPLTLNMPKALLEINKKPIIDYIVDESTLAPESLVSQESLLDDITGMLEQLSQKERDVLILRFGLNNDGNKKTLDEIGSIYGVSRERIRQIENRAISKLKKLCKNKNMTAGLKNYFGE